MALRMYADEHAIPLSGVTTRVTLDRTSSTEAVFEYEIRLDGSLTQEQRNRLLETAGKCPVRKTLSKGIGFLAR
jgi:putative redox protein